MRLHSFNILIVQRLSDIKRREKFDGIFFFSTNYQKVSTNDYFAVNQMISFILLLRN